MSTLIDRGVLRDVPGRTAGEFRIELAETEPALTEPFAAASGLFEDAWYGDAPTGPDDAARFAELADTVQRGAGG